MNKKQKQSLLGLFLKMTALITVLAIMAGELVDFFFIISGNKLFRAAGGDPLWALLSVTPFFVVLLAALSVFFIWLSRMFSKLTQGLSEMAEGNFSYRINLKKSGSFEHTFKDFNKMAEQLNKTATLQDDFTNHFSHEFKTPITSIKGFADLLQEDDLPKDKEQLYLRLISQEAGRLNEMADSVMTLTRLDGQTVLDDRAEFDLTEQVRQDVILFLPIFDQKEIRYQLDLAEIRYFGSQKLLAEVWTNLLSNASKYMNPGGLVEISAKEDENSVRVAFKNDGPLIPKDELDKLCQKFYQLDTDHQADGLGLGLAIVKRILDLHQGRLEIVSSPAEQTVFTVVLPKKTD